MFSSPSLAKQTPEGPARRLRQACDACHRAKTKCCGSRPCTGCARSGNPCVYSQSNRVGRPKGTKNKKSLEVSTKQQQQQQQRSRQGSVDSSTQWPSNSINYEADTMTDVPLLTSRSDSTRPSISSASSTSSFSSAQTAIHDMPRQPLHYDYDTDASYSTYPNIFLGPSASYDSFAYPLLTPDISMEPVHFDFNADITMDDMQCAFGMPTSTDLQVMADANEFSWCLPHANPVPGFADKMTEYHEHDGMSNKTYSSSGDHSSNVSACNSPGLAAKPKVQTNMNPPLLVIPDTMDENSLYSPLKTPIALAPHERSKCLCLHHHAKLLVRLQELWKGMEPAPLDVVLNGVQEALRSWDHYIQCRICQMEDDQEVLLLSAMSIRGVLRLLQNTLPRMPSTAKAWRQEEARSKQQNGGAKFSVGSYEIKGEERLLVLELVLSNVLAKIQSVLACLKTKFSRQPATASSISREFDIDSSCDYLHKLLQGLERSVHTLSTDLRN